MDFTNIKFSSGADASKASSPSVPWIGVSSRSIVSVEHPYIIRDIDKGIASLGSQEKKLDKLVTKSSEAQASLYLRPGERATKPLHSTNVKTDNVLLKITIPKRTGLKRRRGASGPYHQGTEQNGSASSAKQTPTKPITMIKDARDLVRGMRDNPNAYDVEAVGEISQTHRFRGMPDFVLSTANAPFMQKIKEHILPFEYEKLKNFKFDMTKGDRPNTEIIPPPTWSHFDYPFNYSYHQNPAVKQVIDDFGKVATVNVGTATKQYSQAVPYDVDVVPDGPDPNVAPIESLVPAFQKLIMEARELLEERPIFTRRSLPNCMQGELWDKVGPNTTRYIYQYVGYIFQSGPWRDAIIKFGVDPRKDPKYRIYQTLVFMLEKEPDNRSKALTINRPLARTEQELRKERHMFDGKTVSKDGKTWQICDITDPAIKEILDTKDIRPECQIENDGWYYNGTLAKAKILTREKMGRIIRGEQQADAIFAKIARTVPDRLKRSDTIALPKGQAGHLEMRLRASIRSSAMTYKPGQDTKRQKMADDVGEDNENDADDAEADASGVTDMEEWDLHQIGVPRDNAGMGQEEMEDFIRAADLESNTSRLLPIEGVEGRKGNDFPQGGPTPLGKDGLDDVIRTGATRPHSSEPPAAMEGIEGQGGPQPPQGRRLTQMEIDEMLRGQDSD